MTRVYVDMVADLFHAGHVEFLRQARALGDELVVGIHADDAVASYKRRPIMTMEERIAVVEACRYVHAVVPNAPLSMDRDWIDLHAIDVVVHGDDFDEAELARWYSVPIELGIMRTVRYTPGVSTSEILQRLASRGD
jgi:cytidyltransferase-like protein